MEIMEDGNLVDRVRILLQRDMQYYQSMQTVLRESLCVRVCGGKLDFPRHASFAAIKIVTWWEAEFREAFMRPSGLTISNEDGCSIGSEGAIKKTPPSEFILLIIDTSEQLLEHLHTLIQESLDHADLTVLTATLGAAALIRNCLWCYNQQSKDEIPAQSSEKLSEWYKSYNEMTEAVAERLLDLHCRLISLYILNEAESLSWHKNKSFFEKERCSFTIQMWWLYMQGTKADLWNTVSPKMAQRVFSGMLNESLSIIVTRFIHGRPSLARSEQFWADAFNVLCCSAYLTLSACVNADELIGLRPKKLTIVMRDIHAKCGELLFCLLLRGTPLRVLYQECRNGLENMTILQQRCGPSPWLLISAPKLLGRSLSFGDYASKTWPVRAQVILELNVLRSQPQPNWTQLLKVFTMNDCVVARMLFSTLLRKCIGYTEIQSSKRSKNGARTSDEREDCGGFLCTGTACDRSISVNGAPASVCLYSLAYVTANSFMDPSRVFIPALKQDANWSNYLDRHQVWNQSRPPWLNALLAPLRPMILPIVETLLDAVKTGASVYQAMSLALACMTELFVCAPFGVLSTCLAMNENLPAQCHPLGGSVLLQILCATLYTALLEVSVAEEHVEVSNQRKTPRSPEESGTETSSFDPQDRSASATALAEALCSIDEDNKHTDQIESFLNLIERWIKSRKPHPRREEMESMPQFIETYTNTLLFTDIGRRSLKILINSSLLLSRGSWYFILGTYFSKKAKNHVLRNVEYLEDRAIKNLLRRADLEKTYKLQNATIQSSIALDYLLRASDWVLKNLEANDTNIEEDFNNTTDVYVASKPLTYTMFHIDNAAFDQFLTDFDEVNWLAVLKTPISGTLDRVRSQILVRPEFKNIGDLDYDQREVATAIKLLCSMGRSTRFQ